MIDALPASGLPTLSQIQGWQTAHLRSAARRWRVTADTWTSIYDDIAADLSAKSEIVWEGDASTAAQARTKRDRDTVELLAERLYFGASIAESGAAMVDQAKEEALLVVRVAGALAFDVREDLSLVDRLATGSPAATAVRLQQSNVLAATVRVGAAQLVSTDHAVAQRLREATDDFDSFDFARNPIIQPLSTDSDEHHFGTCFAESFKEDVGKNMVQGVFVGGAIGAARGALMGILGGPIDVFGGGVLGFVGGAAGGALISGPARTAVTSAWDCL